ncbi:[Fe-Fe] hydrogenase large subunit C-terminal domain-containing protein [Clostridium faecium]|uniref:4Fe-4S binding protein n=1 Tax=Clostridium faecium TaxID=2762223 RepID=A0ABR8YPM2_9CLOT|nr:[Fe-Fe] hydrogenase large subunit C-terminal domain-containing protein [Clostridium faecium]MBD8046201.1 4Fe-4S binding protein [Clostridium faecium]MDU1350609.1 [Fe-Fe] hydrogenase large subunit C-terminal domain-containing protein [Clostridium argentinense]
MKAEYSDLFKALVDSYSKGNFEEKVVELLNDNLYEKENIAAIISSLCGVEIPFGDNYIDDIKKAILKYTPNHKIVDKVKNCTMDCVDIDGKTSCQRSCPFDAILIDKNFKTTYIDNKKCTDCGFCVEGCPTGSILDRVEFLPLSNILRNNNIVIAAVAPAITNQFNNANINQLRTAFMKIGFTDMVEVAFFADMLTLKEAVEFDAKVKSEDDFMITSCCCPMWVAMLKRVYEDLVKHVSPSISPMIASGRIIKALNPNVKVVFIGPCVAKKAEAKEKDLLGDIDFVLTFSEMQEIFNVFDVKPEELPETPSIEYTSRGGRLYARTGGVSIAIAECVERLFPEKSTNLISIQANGIKECKELLSKAMEGEIEGNFIEGMGCVGGCVGGPKAILDKELGKIKVNEFADSSKIKVSVDSETMNSILGKININKLNDFLNHDKTNIFHRDFY